jgi:hypothetical protein
MLITKQLEAFSKSCVLSIEGPQGDAARVQITLAFDDTQRVVPASVRNDI